MGSSQADFGFHRVGGVPLIAGDTVKPVRYQFLVVELHWIKQRGMVDEAQIFEAKTSAQYSYETCTRTAGPPPG